MYSTELELLQSAAGAAELQIAWDDWLWFGDHRRYRTLGSEHYWNALHNNYDAFNLAVDLRMDICIAAASDCSSAVMMLDPETIIETTKFHMGDAYQATRLAIVTTAAEYYEATT